MSQHSHANNDKISDSKTKGISNNKKKLQSKTTMDKILHLQRTIGNQAVNRFLQQQKIQAKLPVSNSKESSEIKSDRTADRIMRMPVKDMRVDRLVEQHNGNTHRYLVTRDDFGHGSGPDNQIPDPFLGNAPAQINWKYTAVDENGNNGAETSGQTDNPDISATYPNWDAGHILAQQSGGHGGDDNIFPQNPVVNEGKRGTRPDWREIEDDFHAAVPNDEEGFGIWSVGLGTAALTSQATQQDVQAVSDQNDYESSNDDDSMSISE